MRERDIIVNRQSNCHAVRVLPLLALLQLVEELEVARDWSAAGRGWRGRGGTHAKCGGVAVGGGSVVAGGWTANTRNETLRSARSAQPLALGARTLYFFSHDVEELAAPRVEPPSGIRQSRKLKAGRSAGHFVA